MDSFRTRILEVNPTSAGEWVGSVESHVPGKSDRDGEKETWLSPFSKKNLWNRRKTWIPEYDYMKNNKGKDMKPRRTDPDHVGSMKAGCQLPEQGESMVKPGSDASWSGKQEMTQRRKERNGLTVTAHLWNEKHFT